MVFQRFQEARDNGHIEADVTQACVVSLEPVPGHITETFSADGGKWTSEP